MQSKKRTALVPVSDIEDTFQVRTHTHNAAIVDTLRMYYKEGADLGTLIVYEKAANPTLPPGRDPSKPYGIVEGRTRHTAISTENPEAVVEVEIRDYSRMKDPLMAVTFDAVTANQNGKQLPSSADNQYSLLSLFRAGKSHEEIRKVFTGVWPRGALRRMLNSALSRYLKQVRVKVTRNATEKGISLQDSAGELGFVWKNISRAWDEEEPEPERFVRGTHEYRDMIQKRATAYNRGNGQTFPLILEAVEDQELTYEEGVEMAEFALEKAREIMKYAQDFERRMKQKSALSATV